MFTTTKLTNDRVLVTGTDLTGTAGKTVLDASQWVELNGRTDFNKAQLAFDEAVEQFFAPLSEAAEKLDKAMTRPTDASAYIVLDEGSEGEAARPAHIVALNHDSIVLRLIEEGSTDRLIWVGETLEVIAPAPVSETPIVDTFNAVMAEAEATDEG